MAPDYRPHQIPPSRYSKISANERGFLLIKSVFEIAVAPSSLKIPYGKLYKFL